VGYGIQHVGHVLNLWNWEIIVRKSEVIDPNGTRTCSLSNLRKYECVQTWKVRRGEVSL
jgi:hypothetical protein